MALYEYKCKECSEISEILVFSSEETPKCKHCGSPELEKLFSSFAVPKAPLSPGVSTPGCPAGSCCYGGSCGLE